MPPESVPSPLERRHLIEKDLPAEKRIALAEAYLAEGRAAEAVVFLEQAGARDRLETLAADAEASGDAFLFKAAFQALGDDPPSARWIALADNAERAGKLRHAETARRQATRHDD